MRVLKNPNRKNKDCRKCGKPTLRVWVFPVTGTPRLICLECLPGNFVENVLGILQKASEKAVEPTARFGGRESLDWDRYPTF